jgi:hypothetical protein
LCPYPYGFFVPAGIIAAGLVKVTEVGGVKTLASSTHGWQEYCAGVVAESGSPALAVEVAEPVVTGILKPWVDWSVHV